MTEVTQNHELIIPRFPTETIFLGVLHILFGVIFLKFIIHKLVWEGPITTSLYTVVIHHKRCILQFDPKQGFVIVFVIIVGPFQGRDSFLHFPVTDVVSSK